MKLTPTRRGILALAVLGVISLGVRASQNGSAGEEWNFKRFLAHFISSLTSYVTICYFIILGAWFTVSGPKKN